MATDLSAIQVKRLKDAGIPASMIRGYQLGTLSRSQQVAVRNVANGGEGTTLTGNSGPYGQVIFGPGIRPRSPLPPSNPVPTGNSGPYGLGAGMVNLPATSTRKPTPFGSNYPTGYGSGGPYPPGWTGPRTTGGSVVPRSTDKPGGLTADDLPDLGGEIPDNGPMPGLPDFNPVPVPVLEDRYDEMLQRARQIAADSFGPYLAGFDLARQNAQAQGKTSSEAMKGAYAQLDKDLKTQAKQTANEYAGLKKETAKRGAANQQQVAANAQSADANMIAMLKSMGYDASEANPTEMLQGNAQTMLTEQGDAAEQTEGQQQYFDKTAQARADADASLQGITRQEGAVVQQDLGSQLANLLTQIDLNKAGAQGDVSTTALSLAQSLADRDMAMQQANAGYQVDAAKYGNQMAQQGYENQFGQWEAGTGLNQQNWENEFNVNKTLGDWQLDLAKLNMPTGESGMDLTGLTGQPKLYAMAQQFGLGPEVVDSISALMTQFDTGREGALTEESIPATAAQFANEAAQKIVQANPSVSLALARAFADSFYRQKWSLG